MRRALGTVTAVAAGLLVTGCANFDGPTQGSQQGVVGPVQITNQFCTEAFGSVTTSSGTPPATRRGVASKTVTPTTPAGCLNNQPAYDNIGGGTGQLLLGYDLPLGTPPPASFTAAQSGDGAAATPLAFHLDTNGDLAKALKAHYGELAGHAWAGYVSDETTIPTTNTSSVNYVDVVSSPLFSLPTPGAPFAGPFDVITALGDRMTGTGTPVAARNVTSSVSSSLPPNRAVNCSESPQTVGLPGLFSLTFNTTDCFDDRQSGGVATRDLGIIGGSASAAQGTTAAVPFSVQFAGSADPSATFSLLGNSNLPGAAVSSQNASYTPASDSKVPQVVNVVIPPNATVGDYQVALSATVGGITRTGTATLTVTKAPAPPSNTNNSIGQVGGFNVAGFNPLNTTVTLDIGPTQTSTLPYSVTATGQVQLPGSLRAVTLPNGVTKARACAGSLVAVQIKVDKKTVSNRLATVNAKCAYSKTVHFRLRYRLGPSGTFTIRAHFLGNPLLRQSYSSRHSLAYGG